MSLCSHACYVQMSQIMEQNTTYSITMRRLTKKYYKKKENVSVRKREQKTWKRFIFLRLEQTYIQSFLYSSSSYLFGLYICQDKFFSLVWCNVFVCLCMQARHVRRKSIFCLFVSVSFPFANTFNFLAWSLKQNFLFVFLRNRCFA